MSIPRTLLARLRDVMARTDAQLPDVARLVAAEMAAEVCAIYVMRPGEVLELAATEGLNPLAVGRTRLRVGEGIVGLCAATGTVMNLPDAQNHPAFAYRPETAEDPFASLLAVPIHRAGRRVGVLSIQNRLLRNYGETEVEALETVAMVLAEGLAMSLDSAVRRVTGASSLAFAATPLAGGIAVGPVVIRGMPLMPKRLLADDVEAEQNRLREATQAMQRGVDALIDNQRGILSARREAGATREVLEAYRLVAADTGWLRRVNDAILDGLSAEAGLQRVLRHFRERMSRISDPYLRERLADIEDMAGRLLTALAGDQTMQDVPPAAILVTRRLGAAELLEWQARGVAGLVVEEATSGGHATILARALAIPMVGGLRGVVDAATAQDEAILDADEGQVVLRPEARLREYYDRALEARQFRRRAWAAEKQRPADTRDGVHFTLLLNVGLAVEIDQLEATNADGIGLLRTEIMALARGGVPDVAEQVALYSRVLDAARGRPVVFRTLDLGSDKVLPGSDVQEQNPAMGWRSIRVGLDRPSILRRQLRALLLAANGRPLSIMFPMIASVAEFAAARRLLDAELRAVPNPPVRLDVGTMLEVPALLWDLPALLRGADFVSIGSNDLLQFLFAADRAAPALMDRYDLLSPVVLGILEGVVRQCDAAGKPVSLCGEAAGRPIEALALAAIGLRRLSMPATGLPAVKDMLTRTDVHAVKAVVDTLRRTSDPGVTIRAPLSAWAREQGLI